MPRIQMPNSGKVLRRSAVGIEGVNMKVELTDKEVRGIGESRWMKAYWLKLLVCLLVVMVLAAVTARYLPENAPIGLDLLWMVPVAAGFGIALYKSNKAGKRLLAEHQGEEKEGQSQEQ